jgi:membrane-associated phospholipid phosphatase
VGIITNVELVIATATLVVIALYGFIKVPRGERRAFFGLYLLLPALSLIFIDVAQTLCYSGTRLLTESVPHLNFGTPLDAMLPLIPFFILFYLLAYVVILFAPFYIVAVGVWAQSAGGSAGGGISNLAPHKDLQPDKNPRAGAVVLLKRYLLALLILFVISAIIYIFFPNDVPHAWQPDDYAAHTGLFDRILQFMYDSDGISNGLPSLHNAHIWLVFFVLLFNLRPDKANRRALLLAPVAVIGVLISLSTLFCKEHYLVDVVFSVALVAALALLTSKCFSGSGRNQSQE